MKKIIIFFILLLNFTIAKAQLYTELEKIVASDREPNDTFGYDIEMHNNTLIVSSLNDDLAGSAYIFESDNNGNWTEVQKITASDAKIQDQFGFSVSLYGDFAVVGVPFKKENNTADTGAVYIFRKNNTGTWEQTQKIIPAGENSPVRFGHSVSVYENYLLIGCPRCSYDLNADGSDVGTFSGKVFVFTLDNNGLWQESEQLTSSDRQYYDEFGFHVDLNGSQAIISTPYEDEDNTIFNAIQRRGGAYIFERDNSGNFIEMAKLFAPDGAPEDKFGLKAAIYNEFAIVGAPHNDYKDTNGNVIYTNAGSAYTFQKQSDGTWVYKQKLISTNLSTGDLYGNAVGISGQSIIVGAPYSDPSTFQDTGEVFAYAKYTNGNWILSQVLSASDKFENDVFGFSLAISDDTLIVGAIGEDEDDSGSNTLPESGSLYVFNNATSLGIEEETQVEYSVYPNPTAGKIAINTSDFYDKIKITICNSLGQELKTQELIPVNNVLDFQIDGPPGIYFLDINTFNKKTNTFIKIIKI